MDGFQFQFIAGEIEKLRAGSPVGDGNPVCVGIFEPLREDGEPEICCFAFAIDRESAGTLAGLSSALGGERGVILSLRLDSDAMPGNVRLHAFRQTIPEGLEWRNGWQASCRSVADIDKRVGEWLDAETEATGEEPVSCSIEIAAGEIRLVAWDDWTEKEGVHVFAAESLPESIRNFLKGGNDG